MNSCVAASEAVAPAKPAWRAVYSLGLGVFGLITAEFLPASLLTPMAASLGVTEGMAGQAVTATALVALVTGLLITPATRRIDRRWVLMFFSVLQIISSLLVAFAPNLHVLLMGRLLLGIAIGGFWAMSTATTMRLVPADKVPKALAVIFSSVSIATVVAAPLGSYLGSLIGWRNVFILCILPSMLALLWQLWVLPSMKPESSGSLSTLFRVLRRVDHKKSWSYFVGALSAPLLNTIFFMGYIVLVFYKTDYIQERVASLGAANPLMFVVLLVGVQGLIEIIVGCAVGGVLARAVASFLGHRAPAKAE